MKLSVLVDNNTLIDRYFYAEPGLSLLIEDEGVKTLFDVGYSDIFLRNAIKLGESLTDINYLVLSHSHLDHTWGLDPLVKYYIEQKIEKLPLTPVEIVTHPEMFVSVTHDDFSEFGTLFSKEKLEKHFPVTYTKKPFNLTSKLIYLGEIPRRNSFENKLTFGRKDNAAVDDRVPEDSALVYKSEKGLIIISGCSHAGICNIIEYAKEVCNESRVYDIIGGLHLQNPSQEQLDGTLDYLEKLNPHMISACHCTDLHSKIALSKIGNIREVGSGLIINYDD